MKIALFIMFLCFVVVLYGYYMITDYHERIHVTYLSYYGIDADYELYSLGLGGGKIKANMTQLMALPEEKRNIIRFFDSVNELVTYQFLILYWIISGMFLLTMFSWLSVLEK